MNGLGGDELSQYAERHFITKLELANAFTGLRKLEGQAQQHFRAAYMREPRPGIVA
jgi:hypothetical protein